MATRGTRKKGRIESAKTRRPSSPSTPSSTHPGPPLSPLTPKRAPRLFIQRPQGRGFLRDNPRSTKFAYNKSFQDRRGYYYKDALGRWRSPDGKVAPGQRRVEITTRTGERQTLSYTLRKAEKYNDRRHARLFRIDAINNVRAIGVPLTRKKFQRVVGRPRDPTKVRDRLRTFVRTERGKVKVQENARARTARRQFAEKSRRLDAVQGTIDDAGGPDRVGDAVLREERALRRELAGLAEDVAEFDEFEDIDLDFEAWGDTP